MAITRRDLTGLAVLAATAASALPAQAQTSGRRAEVETLRLRAETLHPRGREAATSPDWHGRWDALGARAKHLSDGAYFIQTRQALGWFKDGHTTLQPFDAANPPAQLAKGAFSLSLPIGVRVFHDGAYVVSAKDEGAPLLGARITHLGSMETAALIRAFAANWPGSEAWAHRWAASMFAPALLHGLGAVDDPAAPISLEAMAGPRSIKAQLRPRAQGGVDLSALQRKMTEIEIWSAAAGDAARGNFIQRSAAAIYISCDALSVDTPTFGAFTRACFAAMEDPAPARLIIDLRRNGGGNNFLFEALRKHVERSRFNRPGALYVMISPQTFSAAQNATNRLERETFALFVGEPSGGSPNHYGDAQCVAGLATGITANISTLPWFDGYLMDKRLWVSPDLPAPQVFTDWRDGRDPALTIAMTHAVTAPADEWSQAITFYFGRPSQAADWRPFWRPFWRQA